MNNLTVSAKALYKELVVVWTWSAEHEDLKDLGFMVGVFSDLGYLYLEGNLALCRVTS